MAYSSVRVHFEIGHDASLRTKQTPEGFTHDWEVFLRGADGTDISYFVEKVVFYLHETFPKPKRVVKEPPYIVKECGYAGFVIPIDVYLRNREEPKKINFQYDLQLQSSGPPISRVLREPRVFQNPSEDFRRKLLRGGGVGVFDANSNDLNDLKKKNSSTSSPNTRESANKLPFLSGASKKHKPELSNSFADLFGTPIRRVTPEPKKTAELAKKIEDKKKPVQSKPTLTKDEKEKSKDKSKEKVKPISSPKIKEETKKIEEPKKDEEKKKSEKEKHKHKDGEKVSRKKKKKESDVTRKDEKHEIFDDPREQQPEKERHKHKHKKKEKEKSRDKEKHKKDRDKLEKGEKERDVDRTKRKHDDTHDPMRRTSRSPSPVPEKIKKGPLGALFSELSNSNSPYSEEEVSLASSTKSDPPVRNDKLPNFSKTKSDREKTKSKRDEDRKIEKSSKKKLRDGDYENMEPEIKRHKLDFKSKDKSQTPEKDRLEDLQRKQREEELERKQREKEEEEKRAKERERKEKAEREKDRERERERERDRAREREREEELNRKKKEAEELEAQKKAKVPKKDKEGKRKSRESKQLQQQNESESTVPSSRSAHTAEYIAQLRELQHRIITLEDDAELQKVVKVIADSGQYEVTKKTFDFDLCALDYGTVRRLQECFAAAHT